ncbi:putative membrane protein [Abditibacterium utsteinense]|uniref:Putative membrane protein n=1 Tax=Abditibacterium utsteinense TaxID=1960156 RepID=A0A2S8SPN8_9BACT|nr:TMEM175 family protein [Abditibacterium utsteinense]PQV62765.1 putative membrane protein [Abditibacterium utsteinense]
MPKGRLEAFSDGVLAIIITIMVLELKVPHDATFGALQALGPVFISYVLSFIYVGIYWNNHHHMLHAARGVSGGVLWANLHLLFWLSILPFATAWMGENYFVPLTVALYGAVLWMCALAFRILAFALVRQDGDDSPLAAALGRDFKGKISIVVYAAAIPLSFVNRWLALGMYVAMSILWLVPDTRIEKRAMSGADTQL